MVADHHRAAEEPIGNWSRTRSGICGIAGDRAARSPAVKAFHHQLCTTRVLDPACGTGNFLYVSLELMKRLEGEVLEALDDLGDDQARFAMEGETVSPRQFYGLELNERAVPIADLVLVDRLSEMAVEDRRTRPRSASRCCMPMARSGTRTR